MNKTIITGITAGVIVLGLILVPLAIDQAEAKKSNRIVLTESLDSAAHRATGHEGHQAIEVLPPMQNVLYKGTLSYTASKAVDILVYHKLTGEGTGQTIHEVDGVKYTVQKVASGNSGDTKFVGDAVLFHVADAEPYSVTVSIDALARAKMGELPKVCPPT